jgi:glycosyltransferase involved in cell wall biosynthesis
MEITLGFSFVIAVKNRVDLLKESLVSIARQTVEEWECIVVDDYSDEDIEAVVSSMGDPRFRYFRNSGRAGVASARNFGNRQARADWIAVADSDDINLPRRLEVSQECLRKNPSAQIIYGSICTFTSDTFELGPWGDPTPYDRAALYGQNYIPHNAAVYSKKLVLEVPYNEDLESAEDYDLWLSFSDRHVCFAFVPELLVLYRRHAEQFSTDPERKRRMHELSFKIMDAHARFK